jgi:hypothetical protein
MRPPSFTKQPSARQAASRMCNMQCDRHPLHATMLGQPGGCTRVSPGRPDAKVKSFAAVADAHHVDVRCSSRNTIQRPDLHVSPRSIYHTRAALVLLSAWSHCKLEHSSRTGSNPHVFPLRSRSRAGRVPSNVHMTWVLSAVCLRPVLPYVAASKATSLAAIPTPSSGVHAIFAQKKQSGHEHP